MYRFLKYFCCATELSFMRFLSILLILFWLHALNVSTVRGQVFEQRANYFIDVTLQPDSKMLTGKLELEYFNQSDSTLNSLFFHLFANAYRSAQTPFAQQKAADGDLAPYFASHDQKGNINKLQFSSQGDSLTHKTVLLEDGEIIEVFLKNPLKPGEKVVLKTAFELKIPFPFSRMGAADQQFNITQWFPKVAQYDKDGWHTFPYLDWGEYYDAFGDYLVNISVPRDFRVAATGNLMNENEKNWLIELAKGDQTIENPATDSVKTLTFEAKNVHDFAWFASPDYQVRHKRFTSSYGEDIDAWAFFNQDADSEWEKACSFLEKAINHYSEIVGPYAYHNISVVNGPLKAGSGMEYPTITVVGSLGQLLERTVIHEVGHNWFQGMLGTNERLYPYLDEGFNTYVENRFFENRSSSLLENVNNQLSHWLFLHQCRRATDQPANLHSTEFTRLNYSIVPYFKTGRLLEYLEGYIGRENMDRSLQLLFNEFVFRHPDPNDFQSAFERASGKQLNWFFNDLLSKALDIDYAIKSFDENGALSIEHKSGPAIPLKLVFINDGEEITSFWTDPVVTDTIIQTGLIDVDEVYIDFDYARIDAYPANDHWGAKGHKKGVALRLLMPFDKKGRQTLVSGPALGANTSDGFMLGVFLMNSPILQPKTSYVFAPLYGLQSSGLAGTASLSRHYFGQTKRRWQHLEAGIKARRFHLRQGGRVNGEVQFEAIPYTRINPFIQYEWKKLPLRNPVTYSLTLEGIFTENPQSYTCQSLPHFTTASNYFGRIKLERNRNHPLFQTKTNLNGIINQNFLRLSGSYRAELPYKEGKTLRLRLFGGYSPAFLREENCNLYAFNLSNTSSRYDFLYDGLFPDRAERSSFWSHQIMPRDGNFRTPFTFNSNSWMATANLSAALPVTPFRLFASLGALPQDQGRTQTVHWEAGLEFELIKDVATFYMPLAYSSDIQKRLTLNNRNFIDNLSFMLRIEALNPLKLTENLDRLF